VEPDAWLDWCSMDHSQPGTDENGNYLVFHTVPKQNSSEVFTVSPFAVNKYHPLLWHLNDGMQEEYMLDMIEVLKELQAHPEELAEFIKEVDTSANNCLLLKAW
jgi:hypothetical protein